MQAHQLQPEIDQSHPQLIGEKYAFFFTNRLVPGGLSKMQGVPHLRGFQYRGSHYHSFYKWVIFTLVFKVEPKLIVYDLSGEICF